MWICFFLDGRVECPPLIGSAVDFPEHDICSDDPATETQVEAVFCVDRIHDESALSQFGGDPFEFPLHEQLLLIRFVVLLQTEDAFEG